jgi:tol-pal system protein YbgF
MQPQAEYTPPPATTTQPMAGTVQTTYNNALDDYYNRDFDKAIGKFSQILTQHPRSTLADNSQYWLAECYYGLEDYHRAIEEFSKVFSYADTEKDDDAQLKLGFCYANIGDSTQALAAFRKLLNLYPDSEFADVASRRIEELSP